VNLKEEKYARFALVREMLETADVVKRIDVEKICAFAEPAAKVLLTGEGSSRIFPAKNLLCTALVHGYAQSIYTENATQAREYKLEGFSVFVASNSGKTAEGVRLIRHLHEKKQGRVTGVVAHANTPIMDESDEAYLLGCGDENAVAATKSVVEQALFYDLLFRHYNGAALPNLDLLGRLIEQALTAKIPAEVAAAVADAPTIYFAGRNNGVAEELTLKTNEITRRRSDYLEGTYAVHGIEEIMSPREIVILIDPFPEEEEKFTDVLVKGVGMKVVAVAPRQTSFPTFVIPEMGDFSTYIQLAAGWNLLVETGIGSGINLDKPERARKVGNEFSG
jgi:glucosamine--fructose-6-phosphate aminotransferase (isomerizing)